MKFKSHTDAMGWGLAATLVGILAGTGFQGPGAKYAIVDIASVANQSDLGKADQATIQAAQKQRIGLLTFISQYRVVSPDSATQLRDLTLLENPTDQNKADLLTLQAKIEADTKKYSDLQAETKLSPEDQLILNDFQGRVQKSGQLLSQWDSEFTNDLQTKSQKNNEQVVTKVRETAAEVAKEQGCTLVFDANIAPYSSTDLTDATLQMMNTSK